MSLPQRIFERLPPGWQHAARRARQAWRDAMGRGKFWRQLRSGAPRRIIVGTAGKSQPGWIATDIGYLNLLHPDDWATFFPRASLEAILAEHVWEHLTPADGLIAAHTCFDYLQPGGYVRVAVPDGLHPDPAYREWVRVGGTGDGADDHQALYTHETLGAVFARAGFEIALLEYFDAHGNFHAVDWDPADGLVRRSRRFDPRNAGGTLHYTSLILDARKPAIQDQRR